MFKPQAALEGQSTMTARSCILGQIADMRIFDTEYGDSTGGVSQPSHGGKHLVVNRDTLWWHPLECAP